MLGRRRKDLCRLQGMQQQQLERQKEARQRREAWQQMAQ